MCKILPFSKPETPLENEIKAFRALNSHMIRLQKIAVKQGRRTLDEAIRAIDAGHAEMLDVACTDHGMVTIRMRLLAGSTLRAKK